MTASETQASPRPTPYRCLLADRGDLAYFQTAATPDFWDNHWEIKDIRSYVTAFENDGVFVPQALRLLPKGSLFVEGGCGRGQIVHALHAQGYRCVGVDYAKRTVEVLNTAIPELDIRLGDVRELPFEDATVDGYISCGVIEHFWEGYIPILREAARVLRIGGYAFITFPYMSPLRRLKACLGLYPTAETAAFINAPDNFYQFALSKERVKSDLRDLGLIPQKTIPVDGLKGFKDEVALLKPFLQPIYDGKKHLRLRAWLLRTLKYPAGHCAFIVARKEGSGGPPR